MLYRLLKIIVRTTMLIFCRRVVINDPQRLLATGPLLLACNHPNSFLDSVILDILFKQPVWSLARGDVFRNKFIARMLMAMKILPVYRTSEGVENLSENYKTFDACMDLFRKGHTVMIFSEGKCINEWHLRPLKKGTARLAIRAWEQGIPLRVLPVGINYSSFRRFGKNVFINAGTPISREAIPMQEPDGTRHQAFNKLLRGQLEQLVYEIPGDAREIQRQRLTVPVSLLKKIVLFIPALAGRILHAPLYYPVKRFTWKRTNHNDHYDSVLISLLVATYPFYLLLITGIAAVFFPSAWLLLLFIFIPFFAWAAVQLAPQLDR